MRPNFTSLFIYLLWPFFALGQKEANNWYFGYGAGLNFNSTPPTVLDGGQTITREGVAAISDRNTGQLLFYTDGARIWDASHEIMPNGYGLLGDYSSTQSAIIVPYPGNMNQYFVFTSDWWEGTDGFRYSIVDMSLNRGLGDVIPSTKNTLLYIGHTEKLIAARHCNGKDYWLITHQGDSNKFHVHLITENGIESEQIFSKGSSLSDGWNHVGYLKISPNGKFLANAIGPKINKTGSKVEVFNFDPATGEIDGPTVELTGLQFAYGAEFSADSKLLYIAELQDFSSSQAGRVHQYNLSAGNSTAVKASDVILEENNAIGYGALQAGPDGRIYVSLEFGYNIPFNYLDIIENPEIPGTGCNYSVEGIQLGSGNTLIGLPTFALNSLVSPKVDFTNQRQGNCDDLSISFNIKNGEDLDSVQWFFGDQPNQKPQSHAISPIHNYAQAGEYTVTLIAFSKCKVDTISHDISIMDNIEPISVQLPPDTIIQFGEQVKIPAITSPESDLTLQWSPIDWLSCADCPTPVAKPLATTLYTLEVSNPIGCRTSDSILITVVYPAPQVFFPNIFSPNGDGINDYFNGYFGADVKEVRSLKLFDRWGNWVFEGAHLLPNDLNNGWDGTFRGKEMDPAVFVWLAEIELWNGDVGFYKGDLTLVR